MINLDMLPESQAASIATISSPVTQQLLDITAPINDREAFIQDLHAGVMSVICSHLTSSL